MAFIKVMLIIVFMLMEQICLHPMEVATKCDSLILPWECGQEVALDELYMSWKVGGSADCGCTNKCFFPGIPLSVDAPLLHDSNGKLIVLLEVQCHELKHGVKLPGEQVIILTHGLLSSGTYTIVNDTIWITYPTGVADDDYQVTLSVDDGITTSEDLTQVVTLELAVHLTFYPDPFETSV